MLAKEVLVMRQRWKIKIEKFAKIEEASIEIAPFMLFVGDNNTGQSYVMSRLWGIIALGDRLLSGDITKYKSYQKCLEWFDRSILQGNSLAIDDYSYPFFVDWFNEALNDQAKPLVERIFDFPIEIGNISVESYTREAPLKVEILPWEEEQGEGEEPQIIRRTSVSRDKVQFYVSRLDPPMTDANKTRILKQIIWLLFYQGLTSSFPFRNTERFTPLYLPASRTGFMLTYKKLVGELLGVHEEFDENGIVARVSNNQLPLSVIQFLKRLIKLDVTESGRFGEIADMLENEIVTGKINKDSSPVPNYTYKPIGSNSELPLHVTSSLVAELAPLILFLRSDFDYRLLIMEEPEAHLHPQLQRVITKALVRLVNAGLPVWITTHSDTIFSQVNNLITLHHVIEAKPDVSLEEYGYLQMDVISDEDVSVYQFNALPNGKTQIEKLRSTREGFVVPTFNQAIWDVSQEAVKLQNALHDLDENIDEK